VLEISAEVLLTGGEQGQAWDANGKVGEAVKQYSPWIIHSIQSSALPFALYIAT